MRLAYFYRIVGLSLLLSALLACGTSLPIQTYPGNTSVTDTSTFTAGSTALAIAYYATKMEENLYGTNADTYNPLNQAFQNASTYWLENACRSTIQAVPVTLAFSWRSLGSTDCTLAPGGHSAVDPGVYGSCKNITTTPAPCTYPGSLQSSEFVAGVFASLGIDDPYYQVPLAFPAEQFWSSYANYNGWTEISPASITSGQSTPEIGDIVTFAPPTTTQTTQPTPTPTPQTTESGHVAIVVAVQPPKGAQNGFLLLAGAGQTSNTTYLDRDLIGSSSAHPSRGNFYRVAWSATGANGTIYGFPGEVFQGLIRYIYGVGAAYTSPQLSASGFVTTADGGRSLAVNGTPFRFSGANIYWLRTGVSQSGVSYQQQVDTVLNIVSQPSPAGMNETVVRAHTLGIAAGCGDDSCVEPTLGTFTQNSTGFAHIDYVISQAAKDHIRLIIPFVDNWNYGPGGKHTFASWEGDSDDNDFFTDPRVISDFEAYINAILNHKNSITGIVYKDDPTILAWEEGNELVGAPASWVSEIATYIKSIDSHHLVSFGTQFGIQTDTLAIKNVDIEDDHFYPMNASTLENDAKEVYQAGKVYYAGEYGWNSGDLQGFLSAIEQKGQGYLVSGDTYWSLFPKGVDHEDAPGVSFTLHFPGDDAAMDQDITLLTQHAIVMNRG